jgi:hypothetical protein
VEQAAAGIGASAMRLSHEQWSTGARIDAKSMKFQTQNTEIQIMPQLLLCDLAYSVLP